MEISAVSTGQDLSGILEWFIAYLIVITLIAFLFHVIIAFFIYKDATSMGVAGGALWAVLVMLLPFSMLFGLLIYFISVIVLALAYAYFRSQAGWQPAWRKVQ